MAMATRRVCACQETIAFETASTLEGPGLVSTSTPLDDDASSAQLSVAAAEGGASKGAVTEGAVAGSTAVAGGAAVAEGAAAAAEGAAAAEVAVVSERRSLFAASDAVASSLPLPAFSLPATASASAGGELGGDAGGDGAT